MAFVHTFGAAVAVRFRESRSDKKNLRDECGLTLSCVSIHSPRHHRERRIPRYQLLPVAVLPQRRAGLPPGRPTGRNSISARSKTNRLLRAANEQACFLVCTAAAGAVGGLLASGILKIDSIGWLTEWR